MIIKITKIEDFIENYYFVVELCAMFETLWEWNNLKPSELSVHNSIKVLETFKRNVQIFNLANITSPCFRPFLKENSSYSSLKSNKLIEDKKIDHTYTQTNTANQGQKKSSERRAIFTKQEKFKKRISWEQYQERDQIRSKISPRSSIVSQSREIKGVVFRSKKFKAKKQIQG